ncbi:hypothetical protein CCACVL1_24249 [Corchorus capsularis]|uniref:Uncharacterized protein n=1 Tax=Corchorus capsularis TaxID=210143 RepID=A0A1R3GQJ0_COCAP|nr:hypothetical protein CCACVL1_24249 [Corchorus capsularis]
MDKLDLNRLFKPIVVVAGTIVN